MDKYDKTAPIDKIGGKMHSTMKAKRKVKKAFLKDLWIEWNNIQKKGAIAIILKPKTKMPLSNDKPKNKNAQKINISIMPIEK